MASSDERRHSFRAGCLTAIDRGGDLLCHELLSLYMRHRADAVPSVRETFGLVALEAVAASTL